MCRLISVHYNRSGKLKRVLRLKYDAIGLFVTETTPAGNASWARVMRACLRGEVRNWTGLAPRRLAELVLLELTSSGPPAPALLARPLPFATRYSVPAALHCVQSRRVR